MRWVAIVIIVKTITLAVYNYVNRVTFGILGIIVRTVQATVTSNATLEAAAIAYYTLFSLFPLLMFLVAIGSLFLESSEAQTLILEYVDFFIPNASGLIQGNLEQLIQYRNTVGLFGTVGLLWAATSVFTILAQSINGAWRAAPQRNFLKDRLIAFLILFTLILFLTTFLIFSTILNIIVSLNSMWPGAVIIQEIQNSALSRSFTSWGLMFVAFTMLYRWIPNTSVSWLEAASGAFVSATGWEVSKWGFTWYLTVGLSRYQLIYGSLGTVVAFMLWIYISSLILLIGAHLSAAITQHNRQHQQDAGLPIMPPSEFSSDLQAIFTGEEIAKLLLACITVATVIAEAESEVADSSFAGMIAVVKDIIIAPRGVKLAMEQFHNHQLIEQILHEAQHYNKVLENISVDSYLAHPWEARLQEIADIIEKRLNGSDADTLKQFMLNIGNNVAYQSGGGFLGLSGEKTAHEAAKLEQIAQVLRANHLLVNLVDP